MVKLPADSPRGGISTQGTVLAVTSNPDRTSPVKRGLFVLDNILGTPPPPPPPDIPALEDAGDEQAKAHAHGARVAGHCIAKRRSAVRATIAWTRWDSRSSEFNALGMWRETDHGKPIETAGQLITGEEFADINELKHVLVTNHRQEFYRCLTEKLLTYAFGRGIEYHDTETVDAIVAQLEAERRTASALLKGIIASAAFQKCRPARTASETATIKTASTIKQPTQCCPNREERTMSHRDIEINVASFLADSFCAAWARASPSRRLLRSAARNCLRSQEAGSLAAPPPVLHCAPRSFIFPTVRSPLRGGRHKRAPTSPHRHARTAQEAQEPVADFRRARSGERRSRQRRRRRSRPGQLGVPHRRAAQQECDRRSRRHFHRSGHCQPSR